MHHCLNFFVVIIPIPYFSHNINLGCYTTFLPKYPSFVKPWDLSFVDLFFPISHCSIFFLSWMKVLYYMYNVLPYFYRVDRKERARLKNVKFTGKTSEKVKDIYIHSIEFQLSSSNLHEITFNSRWLNAYPTTLWILYMFNA